VKKMNETQIAELSANTAAQVAKQTFEKMEKERKEEYQKLISEVSTTLAKQWRDSLEAREKAQAEADAKAKAQAAEEAKAAAGRTVPSVHDTALGASPSKKNGRREPNFATKLARVLAIARAQSKPVEEIAKGFGYEDVAKGLNIATDADGGYLVQDTVEGGDFIEFLRARTVLQDIPTIPIKGKLELGRMNTGATVSWVADGGAATISKPTFARVSLVEHKVVGAVPVGNSLIRDSVVELDQIINNDLLRALLTDIDAKAIRGDGTSNTTNGLKALINASNKFSSSGSSVAQIIADLAKMEQLVDEGQLPPEALRVWLLSPRTRASLYALTNSQGFFVFKDEMSQGKLLGRPFRSTTSIPRNLTVNATANTSEVYLVQTDQCRRGVGMDGQYALKAFDGATYNDGGSTVNGVLTDETVFRAIGLVDFAVRHDQCAAFMDTVTY
jgi:HK97 family phage major capsid protein